MQLLSTEALIRCQNALTRRSAVAERPPTEGFEWHFQWPWVISKGLLTVWLYFVCRADARSVSDSCKFFCNKTCVTNADNLVGNFVINYQPVTDIPQYWGGLNAFHLHRDLHLRSSLLFIVFDSVYTVICQSLMPFGFFCTECCATINMLKAPLLPWQNSLTDVFCRCVKITPEHIPPRRFPLSQEYGLVPFLSRVKWYHLKVWVRFPNFSYPNPNPNHNPNPNPRVRGQGHWKWRRSIDHMRLSIGPSL